MQIRRCRATVSGERPARMPLGASPGRRPDVSIREPGDLVERDVSSHPRRSVDEPLTAGFRGVGRSPSEEPPWVDSGGPARYWPQDSCSSTSLLPGRRRIRRRAPSSSSPRDRPATARSAARPVSRPTTSSARRRPASIPTILEKSGGSSAFDYLEAGIGGSLTNASLVAKEALAAIDAKLDPTAFGGHDLLTALDATFDSTTHAYGDGETYTQSLAILALVAAADAGHPLPAGRRHRADRGPGHRRLVGLPGRQGRCRWRRHELDGDRHRGARGGGDADDGRVDHRRTDVPPRPTAERRWLPVQRRVPAAVQRSGLRCERDPGPARRR